MSLTQGPSAKTLYAANPPTGDLGAGTAGMLNAAELGARQQYAPPTTFPEREAPRNANIGPLQNDAPEYYNYHGGDPVKYSVPTAQKERMQARQAIRDANVTPTQAVVRTDPISEEEVSYLQAMQAQAEIADFDRYVSTLVDPRKPGNLKWLMEVYPEFVQRRIGQVHSDYEFALRNQMIDSWGINTFDDLHFKYMVDQGKVDGPRLGRHRDAGDGYAPGVLSPWSYSKRKIGTLKLPFASAKSGRRPRGEDKENWSLQSSTMEQGRGIDQLAEGMYDRNQTRDLPDVIAGGAGFARGAAPQGGLGGFGPAPRP